MEIQRAGGVELSLLGSLAARLQVEPDSFVAYLGDDIASIAADIDAIAGWESLVVTAWDGDQLIGWLLPEVDLEMGRAWWWGPFVAATHWDDGADLLYLEARSALGQIFEEEPPSDAPPSWQRWP